MKKNDVEAETNELLLRFGSGRKKVNTTEGPSEGATPFLLIHPKPL